MTHQELKDKLHAITATYEITMDSVKLKHWDDYEKKIVEYINSVEKNVQVLEQLYVRLRMERTENIRASYKNLIDSNNRFYENVMKAAQSASSALASGLEYVANKYSSPPTQRKDIEKLKARHQLINAALDKLDNLLIKSKRVYEKNLACIESSVTPKTQPIVVFEAEVLEAPRAIRVVPVTLPVHKVELKDVPPNHSRFFCCCFPRRAEQAEQQRLLGSSSQSPSKM